MESHFTVLFSCEPETLHENKFDLFYYDQLGNQTEEYRITVFLGPNRQLADEDELQPPLNLTISTKWKKGRMQARLTQYSIM